jgi:hypothetical protein
MLSRSSVSEPAYLGIITIIALTIAIIVAGEINHLNHPL